MGWTTIIITSAIGLAFILSAIGVQVARVHNDPISEEWHLRVQAFSIGAGIFCLGGILLPLFP